MNHTTRNTRNRKRRAGKEERTHWGDAVKNLVLRRRNGRSCSSRFNFDGGERRSRSGGRREESRVRIGAFFLMLNHFRDMEEVGRELAEGDYDCAKGLGSRKSLDLVNPISVDVQFFKFPAAGGELAHTLY